jgi:hypothetical protein
VGEWISLPGAVLRLGWQQPPTKMQQRAFVEAMRDGRILERSPAPGAAAAWPDRFSSMRPISSHRQNGTHPQTAPIGLGSSRLTKS